jgi:hypothetical protein
MNAHTIPSSPIKIAGSYGIKAATLSLALLFAGCGGGGGGAPAAVNGVTASTPAGQTQAAANAFSTTSDEYGLQNATFLCSSKSSLGIVFRAAVASSLTDQNFKTVSRIDIAPGAAISTSTVYSLGAATAANRVFPGNIYFLNGHPSTLLHTVDGTISFTNFGANSGDRISGSYSAVVEDGNDSSTPKAHYTVSANFDFTTDSYGTVPNASSDALAASSSYDAHCASCHALGSHDTTTTGAGDLALKGGKMSPLFSADQPSHQAIRLAASDISALKVLLNSN